MINLYFFYILAGSFIYLIIYIFIIIYISIIIHISIIIYTFLKNSTFFYYYFLFNNRHDITEILLKVALSTITQSLAHFLYYLSANLLFIYLYVYLLLLHIFIYYLYFFSAINVTHFRFFVIYCTDKLSKSRFLNNLHQIHS